MEPMAYIGAGMCALSMMAAAWGVSQVWTTIISIVGRNPQVKKDVDIYGWAGFAAVEAIALYALVIALVMLTGKKLKLSGSGFPLPEVCLFNKELGQCLN